MILLKNMRVRDEMSRGVIAVGIEDPLTEVIDIMAEKDVSSIVVVFPTGTAAGVISSFDIVKTFLEKSVGEIRGLRAGDVMSDVIIELDPEKTIWDALKLMVEKKVHRVVVLSSQQSGKKPVGILSATDIVKKLRGL